jgi:hypothetical protein
MNEAKIRLSQKEMELVSDATVILTKNAVLQKAMQLLGALGENQQQLIQTVSKRLPADIVNTSAKISKGENYKGLPYQVLDYPRFFENENTFAIRSMFWWGNFFSITLHLSGRFKELFEKKIIHSIHSLNEKGFYFCTNDHAWEHHFEEDNYVALSSISENAFEKIVRERPFIKLAQKIPLTEWDHAGEILFSYFKFLIEILAD